MLPPDVVLFLTQRARDTNQSVKRLMVEMLRAEISRPDPTINGALLEQRDIVSMRKDETALTRMSLWVSARDNWDARIQRIKHSKNVSPAFKAEAQRRYEALLSHFADAVKRFEEGHEAEAQDEAFLSSLVQESPTFNGLRFGSWEEAVAYKKKHHY